MVCVESSSPPGVSSSISRARAPSALAWAMARSSSPAVTGWMVSERTNLSTSGCWADAAEPSPKATKSAAATQPARTANPLTRWIMACSLCPIVAQPRLFHALFPRLSSFARLRNEAIPSVLPWIRSAAAAPEPLCSSGRSAGPRPDSVALRTNGWPQGPAGPAPGTHRPKASVPAR